MANFQTIPWVDAQNVRKTIIRFLPRVLDENKVHAAAQLVSPSFENMQDSFVALSEDLGSGQIISLIPAKPKAETFAVPLQDIGRQEAIRQALEKAANFLKGRV